MRALKPTFDLLFERKRLIQKDLDAIEVSLKALQSKCDHEYENPSAVVSNSQYVRCVICGKTEVLQYATEVEL